MRDRVLHGCLQFKRLLGNPNIINKEDYATFHPLAITNIAEGA